MCGNWELIKPETSKLRNQVKNPSLEASVNNWTASGGTFTRSTEQSYEGAYSGKFVAGAVAVNVKSNGVNLSNGQSIALTLYTYRATSTPTGTVTIYDATNGAARATSTITATADWELHQLTWTNSTGGLVSVEVRLNNTTADSASVIYFDAAMLTYTTYNVLWFDGDRPGCTWVGTRHESVSDMDAFAVSGGRVYDLETDYYFRVTNAPGAGNAPVITNYLPYAIAPGGSYQNSGIGVRDWALKGILVRDSRANWNLARNALLRDLNPNRYGANGTPVLFRYTGGTSTRQIEAYFNGGMENEDPRADKKEFIAPSFVSTDPYWRSPNKRATVLNTETSATMQLIMAKINGLWDVLGPPNASGTYTDIYAIYPASDGKVYIGGNFVNFDNQANGDYIAYYDKITETWGVVSALNGVVQAIVESANGTIYFAGAFTNAGGVAAADYIAQWDGSSVTAVGTPNTGTASITTINALAFDGQGRLWITGDFTDLGNVGAADRLAYWDGSNYYGLSTGLNGTGRALAYDAVGDRMYIGGAFSSAGGVANTARVCYWDWASAAFVAMGTGTGTGQVNAIGVDATGGAYVGGTFTTANGVTVNGIAYWNNTTFEALGTGVGTLTQVNTIAINEEGEVWLGGQFTTANGQTLVDRMAVWSGGVYHSPPVDLPGSADVNAIVFDGEDIYIGSAATGTATFSNTTTITNSGTEKSSPWFWFKRSGGTTAKLVSITNVTTGKEIRLNYDFLNGEEIKIDLRPGKKRIRSSIKGRGGNTLNVGSELSEFFMIPGSTEIATYIVTSGSPTITATENHDDLFLSFD